MAMLKTIRSKKPLLDVPKFTYDCRDILDSWAEGTVRRMQVYPAQKFGRKMKFKTEKQRRYFFYALRKGIIDVPYQRTEALRYSWRGRVYDRGGRLVAETKSSLYRARFTQGRLGQQTKDMAARRWRRIDEQAKKEWDSKTLPKLKKLFQGKKR